MKTILRILVLLSIGSMNYVTGQNIEIDTISHQFAMDSGLNDGGSCWYTGLNETNKKDAFVLITENDKTIAHAIMSINGKMMVLKRDSMQYRIVSGNIQISAMTENISFYSNTNFVLTVDSFTKFEEGQAQMFKATMKVKERKDGRTVQKNLTGECGAN